MYVIITAMIYLTVKYTGQKKRVFGYIPLKAQILLYKNLARAILPSIPDSLKKYSTILYWTNERRLFLGNGIEAVLML